MSDLALLQSSLLVGAILFGLGLIGFLVRRNMIVMFLCAEMMLQGVSMSLVAWSRYRSDWGGQILVIFILTVAACEAVIALALILKLVRHSGSLDSTFWQSLREENVSAFIDEEIPEEALSEQTWPKLTPAGIRPEADPEKEAHRSNI